MRPEKFGVIGIVGAGVVGGSLRDHLHAQGRDVRIYDPPKGYAALEAIEDADVVFICVPTPYTPGVGFDNRYLVDAVTNLTGQKCVVIKSTVLPGTTDLMQERFPQHRFLFNPEFLREATAFEDFVHPDRQIVGLASGALPEDAAAVMELLPRAPFERYCLSTEAEMAKYVANSFLAIKVSYANEVYDLCNRLSINYGQVRDIVATDVRIGASHMDVFDGGYRGYGGKCLPKDSKSLLDLARSVGTHMEVLGAADRVNTLHQASKVAISPITRVRPGVAPAEVEQQAA